MKKLTTILLLLLSLTGRASQYYSSGSGNWSTVLNNAYAEGDTIYIQASHTVEITATVFYPLNLTIVVNGVLEMGNPGHLILGSESLVYINGSVVVTGNNNNDSIMIGSTLFNESFLSTVVSGTVLTKDGALPVKLLYCYVREYGGYPVLSWATAKEHNNDYFEINRSFDGVEFSKVAQVTGAGDSNDIIKYSWMDKEPLSGRVYYRITQVDFDGARESFSIVMIDMGDNSYKIITYDLLGRRVNNNYIGPTIQIKTK